MKHLKIRYMLIKSYQQYINESKNVGILYHVLSMESLKYVIKNNSISGHHYHNSISTTRDKMLNSYVGSRPTAFFKLELDGDKLSNKYKIKPFLYRSHSGVNLEESEEQIRTSVIKPASKYITKIIIIKSKMESARNGWDFKWVDVDERTPPHFFSNDVSEEDSIQFFIKWIKENIEVPIYVQDGSKIYKDDDYINSLINEPVYNVDYGYALYYRGRTDMKKGDIFSQKEALFPIDNKNTQIIYPVVGKKYENLHLITIDNVYSKLNKIDDFIYHKNVKSLSGRECVEEYELYLCKFQLYNQNKLPKSGFINKAKLHDMKPAEWVISDM